MPFVLDTSSFRVLQNYFPERFPSVWACIDALVDQGEIVSVREVYHELESWSCPQWMRDWLARNKRLFVIPEAAETDYVSAIFRVPHFRNMVGQKETLKGKPVADPFVVACAMAREGCVVTEEKYKPNAAQIPNVCKHFGVECTDVEGMMARQGWRF
jgi:hypothetical protein